MEDSSEISWQEICSTATIYIPADLDYVNTGLLDALRKDFAFMQEKEEFGFKNSKVALVRVSALPLGSSIEVELNCDTTRYENDKLDKLWLNYPYQNFYKTLEDYENAPENLENLYGEVYF